VHDADPPQGDDLVAERLAHAPDLPVEALSQDDAEGAGVELVDPARAGRRLGQADARAHACDEVRGDRVIDRHQVLLLVRVLDP
jgi:hypothetical protein